MRNAIAVYIGSTVSPNEGYSVGLKENGAFIQKGVFVDTTNIAIDHHGAGWQERHDQVRHALEESFPGFDGDITFK